LEISYTQPTLDDVFIKYTDGTTRMKEV